MADAFSTRELEWFDLETRMRELIQKQFQPVQKRALEDRENQSKLQLRCEQLESRIKELESSMFGDNDSETAYSKLQTKITEFEGQRKKDCTRLDQELAEFKERFKSFDFQLNGTNEMNRRLEAMIEKINTDIFMVKDQIEDNKGLVLKEMNQVSESFKQLNQQYSELGYRSDSKASNAVSIGESNSTQISNLNKSIDSMSRVITDMNTEMQKFTGEKLSLDHFENEKEKLNSRIQEFHNKIASVMNELKYRDNIVDSYLPLRIFSYVSDAFHFILEKPKRKKFAEYENSRLEELNSKALEGSNYTREEAVEFILEEIKRVEKRKVELLTEKKGKRENHSSFDSQKTMKTESQAPSNPGSVIHSPRHPQVTEVHHSSQIEDMDQIVSTLLEEHIHPYIVQVKQEIQQDYRKALTNVKSSQNESLKFAQQVLEEVEALERKTKNERNDISLEVKQIEHEIDAIKKQDEKFNSFVHSIAQMVVCLVENAQIQQALEAQDEDDRHSMAVNFETELQNQQIMQKTKDSYSSVVPSANFSLTKKCLACENVTSVLSGMRTSLIYRPTPLFYRSKKLNRAQLISLKGNMLRSCWENLSSEIPWKQQDFESLMERASQVLDQKEESKEETNQQSSRDALPVLVSHSMRKSTPSRKRRSKHL